MREQPITVDSENEWPTRVEGAQFLHLTTELYISDGRILPIRRIVPSTPQLWLVTHYAAILKSSYCSSYVRCPSGTLVNGSLKIRQQSAVEPRIPEHASSLTQCHLWKTAHRAVVPKSMGFIARIRKCWPAASLWLHQHNLSFSMKLRGAGGYVKQFRVFGKFLTSDCSCRRMTVTTSLCLEATHNLA